MLGACEEGKCSDSSSLLKLNDWSKLELGEKRNCLVMPQLSLIAMSNFKAIQDENCQFGSERGKSGTYD